MKVNCPCGHQISDVGYPSRNKGVIVKEYDVDAMSISKNVTLSVFRDGIVLWECNKCGRIAVEGSDGRSLKWYAPEDGEAGKLCWFD